jgi:hypothetical protein
MARLPAAVLPKKLLDTRGRDKQTIRVSPLLMQSAELGVAGAFALLKTRPEGLTADEAAARFLEHGPNVLAKDQRPTAPRYWVVSAAPEVTHDQPRNHPDSHAGRV